MNHRVCAEVRVSHLTGHKLTTQEGNAMNWWEKWALVTLADNLTPGLAFPRHSLCYIGPTLLLQSLSEQAQCASSSQKGEVPQNQKAQDERERGHSTGPCMRLGRRRQTKCCSQGILRQLTDDRTPLVHHTLIQSAIEKTTATPLRAYEEPEALGYWVAPKLAILPNCPIPYLKNPLECLRLNQAVPSPWTDFL